jgi:hypothetical protein
METTTVKINRSTKSKLDRYREYRNESYDEVIQKVLYIADNAEENPKLSKRVLKEIEAARERYRRGDYYTAEEMKKRLGL